MDTLKDWAFSVCMACIVVGLLQQFSSSRTNFSVIKLVLTLYILITAFAPITHMQTIDIQLPDIDEENTYVTQIDTQGLIVSQTRQTLEEDIINYCNINDIEVKNVYVILDVEDEQINIVGVELVVLKDADEDRAQQAVIDVIGAKVPVQIKTE